MFKRYGETIRALYIKRQIPVIATILILSLGLLLLILSVISKEPTNTKGHAQESHSLLPMVFITAPKRFVSGKSERNVSFTIHRSGGSNDTPLTVQYLLRSTLDEVPTEPKTIVIPAGSQQATIPVDITSGIQDIAVIIQQNENYILLPNNSATIDVTDTATIKADQKRPVIVTLKTGDPESISRGNNISATHIFKNSISGFSARLTQGQVDALKQNSSVESVEEDHLATTQGQIYGNAVSRIGLNTNTEIIPGSNAATNIDVAIIDTGIATTHPDLNVVGGKNCVAYSNSTSYEDDNSHGTGSAGVVGMKNNDIGGIGTAPGARLWAVKVLDRYGSGLSSDVICGFDFVAANTNTIKVVNASLAVGNSNSLHNAIKSANSKGVTIVASAGNAGMDASTFYPAAYDEVIAVGGIVDTDGIPGGKGPSTSVGNDDTLATWSNYGPVVDITAPGVSVSTTYFQNGGYGTFSGTSASSPVVAGMAAWYKSKNPAASPSQIKQILLSKAALQSGPWGYTTTLLDNTQPLAWEGSIDPNSPLSLPTPTSGILPTGGVVSPSPVPTNLPSSSPTPTPQGNSLSIHISSPLNGAILQKGTSTLITTSTTGTVTKVEFYINGKIKRNCTATSAPFTCNWSIAKTANTAYTLQAIATDTTGDSVSSPVITVYSSQ